MAQISGLKDRLKEEIVDYCNRHKLTLVAWTEKHIREDLLQEKENEGRNENE